MHGNVPPQRQRSSDVPVRAVTDESSTDRVDTSGNEWFSIPAQQLLGSDLGLNLALATGFQERSCYRYAASERAVPGYVIYRLLRSEQGAQWLSALMDGCDAQWWRDLRGIHRQLIVAAKAFGGIVPPGK